MPRAPEGPSAPHDETPGVAVAPDMAGGGMVEERAEHHHRSMRLALAAGPPRLPRLLHVAVEVAAPAGLGDLHGTVHEVAGDHRLAAAPPEAHADVARRVPRRGLEPELLGHAVVHLHQRGEPGLEHRLHAVGQDAPRVLVALAGPVLDIHTRHKVTSER